MNRKEELDYILAFVEENTFDAEISCQQLRSLWTAYCLHHGLDVDTRDYDDDMSTIWSVMSENEEDNAYWSDFDSLNNYLCAELV